MAKPKPEPEPEPEPERSPEPNLLEVKSLELSKSMEVPELHRVLPLTL